ncbi:hypothetical protein YC2023_011921 [Brassica napus]
MQYTHRKYNNIMPHHIWERQHFIVIKGIEDDQLNQGEEGDDDVQEGDVVEELMILPTEEAELL